MQAEYWDQYSVRILFNYTNFTFNVIYLIHLILSYFAHFTRQQKFCLYCKQIEVPEALHDQLMTNLLPS